MGKTARKAKEEWREKLPEQAYKVLFEEATERGGDESG